LRAEAAGLGADAAARVAAHLAGGADRRAAGGAGVGYAPAGGRVEVVADDAEHRLDALAAAVAAGEADEGAHLVRRAGLAAVVAGIVAQRLLGLLDQRLVDGRSAVAAGGGEADEKRESEERGERTKR